MQEGSTAGGGDSPKELGGPRKRKGPVWLQRTTGKRQGDKVERAAAAGAAWSVLLAQRGALG